MRALPHQQGQVLALGPGPDQLDITGARWGWTALKPSSPLRAVVSNGDFGEYWRFHLTREHQRHPAGTAQGKYTLGA